MVSGASADIAFEFMANGGFVEFASVTMNDVDSGHDHAGRAVAALKAVIVTKRFLHRMKLVAGRDAFDCGDFRAIGLSNHGGA